MSTINYQGDPKLFIDKNGAFLEFRGGQPLMDQGLENAALISLFTKKGWHGNAFLSSEEKIGSDFQEVGIGTITATSLEKINQEAVKALEKPFFGNVQAITVNPINYRINTGILIRPPGYDSGVIQIEKNGENWIFQKNNPAHKNHCPNIFCEGNSSEAMTFGGEPITFGGESVTFGGS